MQVCFDVWNYDHFSDYALHFVGKYDTDEIENFIKESLHMKTLNHTNVMRLVGVCLDAGPSPYIVLPYMAGQQFKFSVSLLIDKLYNPCLYYTHVGEGQI